LNKSDWIATLLNLKIFSEDLDDKQCDEKGSCNSILSGPMPATELRYWKLKA